MSDLTTQIISLLTPQFSRATRTPGGVGYVLHDGHVVQCSGQVDAEGALVPGSRHLLGTFVVDPDHKAKYPDAAICVGNDPLQGLFVLADGATFDPSNPVCSACGQPFQL